MFISFNLLRILKYFIRDLLKILNVALKNIILQEIRDGQKIENGKLIPVSNYGIETMSVGYLMKDSDATIMRGPLVAKYIQQLFYDTVKN